MRIKIYLALVILGLSNTVNALQVKAVCGARKIVATIAKDALNRIAVLDDRIAQVFGLEEDFAIETDEKSGQIFIRPKVKKVINLTVITEKHITIDLQLVVEEITAETILLKTKSGEALKTMHLTSTDHANKVTALILAMAKNQAISGFNSEALNKEIIMWQNVKLIQTTQYQGKEMSGEIYQISNNTKAAICLTETQFGLEKNIAGVALKKHTLAPNDQTYLYIVRHNI